MPQTELLKPADLIYMSCPSPTCKKKHPYVVKSVDGDDVELVIADVPEVSISLSRSGKHHLARDGRSFKIVKVHVGAGQEILDKYLAYEALVEEIQAHSYEDLGLQLLYEQYSEQARVLDSLFHDRRFVRPTDLAYGVCRLAGVEPTPALLILIALAMRPRGLDFLDGFTFTIDLEPVVEGVNFPN